MQRVRGAASAEDNDMSETLAGGSWWLGWSMVWGMDERRSIIIIIAVKNRVV